MEAFLISIGIITLAEMGDKTQLLAFMLAARFKQPIPIILGITLATLVNHGLSGIVGMWISNYLNHHVLSWVLGITFILMAIWTLIPETIDEEKTYITHNIGIFSATFTTFFLGEMGDKTQIATMALAAHYGKPLLVIAGTTIGMLLADVPAVLLGKRFAHLVSIKLLNYLAASFFMLMGILSFIPLHKP